MKFISRHDENTQVGRKVHRTNSYHHLRPWICRTFWRICTRSQKELVWPNFDSSLTQWDTDSWACGHSFTKNFTRLCFTKLSEESTDHFCYMAVDLNNQVKDENSVEKLDLPSKVPPVDCPGTLCALPSPQHCNNLLPGLSPQHPPSQGQCPVYHYNLSAQHRGDGQSCSWNKSMNEEWSASFLG